MCSKIEHKLLTEIEFYKVEKKKKLDYIESLNKFKYLQNLRKRKVLIEREQFNNLSSSNVISGLSNYSAKNNLENSFLKNDQENNVMTSITHMKKIELKRLKYPLSGSKSSKDLNIFQKVKQFEQDKIDFERYKEKRQILKEKFNENNPDSFGLFPNQLFTDEEKTIFRNYQFIPEEKVDLCEKKYTYMLEQINKTEKKIKNLGKKSEQNYLDFQCKFIKNEKKQKDLEKININNSITIKQNANKILKYKLLIKEKNKEEKKIDLDLRQQNLRYEKLKEIINISKNFDKIANMDDINEIVTEADDENKINVDANINMNNKNDKDNNDKNMNYKNDKGAELKEEKNEENNKDVEDNQIKN